MATSSPRPRDPCLLLFLWLYQCKGVPIIPHCYCSCRHPTPATWRDLFVVCNRMQSRNASKKNYPRAGAKPGAVGHVSHVSDAGGRWVQDGAGRRATTPSLSPLSAKSLLGKTTFLPKQPTNQPFQRALTKVPIPACHKLCVQATAVNCASPSSSAVVCDEKCETKWPLVVSARSTGLCSKTWHNTIIISMRPSDLGL